MSTRTEGRFRLRNFQPPDFQRLCEIDRVCFPPEIACAEKQLEQMTSEAGAFTIVGEAENGEVAGFVIAAKSGPCSGHIVSLDVLPRFRRQGLATRLMLEAERRLRDEGAEKLTLETPAGSLPPQQLYRKLGFVQTGFVKGYYPDGSDAWLMEKRLAEGQADGALAPESANA